MFIFAGAVLNAPFMKITIISLDNWGFNKYLAEAFRANGHKVTHIDFNKFKYEYPTLFHRICNFFLKLFSSQNLKRNFHGEKIIAKLQELDEVQDAIITIKGDHINNKSLAELKKFTKNSIAFFNDNISKCPKIIPAIPYFDKVYSFEKNDCKKYNLKFCTNWIYNYNPDTASPIEYKYQVFNITSLDSKRLPVISRIAAELKRNAIPYKIIIYDKKQTAKDRNLHFVRSRLALDEVNDYIQKSQTLLDIGRKGQQGLTFRVFESLGLQKKLITTNADIQNYDFYNSNNILIIDAQKPLIPTHFFETAYEKIPYEILRKYIVNEMANELVKDL